jgi:hypothetical protein
MPQTWQQQTIFKNSTSVLPQHVLQKYENAVIDYIIGGDLSLSAAGEPQFCNLVETLTNGCYNPPSIRTILQQCPLLAMIWNNQMQRFLKPSLQAVALVVAQIMTVTVFLVVMRLTNTLPWALLCCTTHSLTLFNGEKDKRMYFRSLSNGNGLPGNARNVNTIGTKEQHGGSGVYFSATITVI